MEFRARLGTPGGEVIEGVYVADSEARLRRELEEKGLYVLSLQHRAGKQLGYGFQPKSRRSRTPHGNRADHHDGHSGLDRSSWRGADFVFVCSSEACERRSLLRD